MSQLLRGALPLLVLRLLKVEELYGYEIVRRIRESNGDLLAPSEGTLYPALHRLEAEGSVEAIWREGDQGPRRRYYRITPKGGARLDAYEREWSALQQAIPAIRLEGGAGA